MLLVVITGCGKSARPPSKRPAYGGGGVAAGTGSGGGGGTALNGGISPPRALDKPPLDARPTVSQRLAHRVADRLGKRAAPSFLLKP